MDTDAVIAASNALTDTGRVTTPLRAAQRANLYLMLKAYVPDMSDDTRRLVAERDLIAMYEAQLRSLQNGKVVADKIAAKYSPNPLLDPLTYKPVSTPTPAPTVPTKPREDYATRKDIATLRSDLNLDYRGRMGDLRMDIKADQEALQRNLTDTLLKVTDALPDVVRGHVTDALKSLTPVTLQVVRPNEAPTVLGMVHRATPQIIRMLAAGVNVYLHGPAGSGKTTAGRKCAEAFGLPFYFAAKVESEYMLLGFKDARGETVRTQFREAYEHGGVFLFDELDGSSPSAVVAMNAALANGVCPFPDGVIQRHENFKCIAAGNTKLTGATREYVGRNQLDAASVDRFAFVEFGYDDALETALATNPAWCAYVQAARRAVGERALKHLVTPRATLDGCKLLEAGLTWDEVEAAVLWKGLDAETVSQVKRTMPKPPAMSNEGIL